MSKLIYLNNTLNQKTKLHKTISAQLKLPEYNQADTMMQGRDSYSVYELEGKSSILTGYEYKLTFISDEEINVEDIVDTETELHLRDETSPLNSKKIYGKIIEAKENGSVARKKLYQIKIVSPLHYLSLNQRYEVYQEMNVPDIISSIIAKYSVLLNIQLDVKIDTQTIPKRHTCTQYKQSDFEFIKMLCEEEGYILLIDASSNNPYTVTLCELNEHAPLNTEIIECTYNKVKTFSTSAQAQDYYENKKPSLDFNIQAGQVMHSHTFADNEVTSQLRSDIKKETLRDRLDKLDESLYKDLSRYAKIDAEQGFSQGIRVLGNSEELSVKDGVVLNLKDIKGHKNTQVIVLSVKYKATFPNALDEYAQVADDEKQAQYSVEFIAIPSDVIYRPQVITSKPRIHSIQTAIVSNTDKDTQKFANEIDVNERGEIKVIFHFDEKRPTSAYVPLSNIYSGDGYGVQFLPRVNSEVIVSFINGDIDRPIITGALHNGENRHPFNLPKEKTKSFIKTQTTPQYEDKEGYNELLFEDKQGEELLRLRAQNDYELNVLNNSNTHIANNKKTIIDNDLELSVQNDSTQTIGNDKKVNILGNEIKTIEKEQILTIKEDQEIHILKDSNSIVNNNSFNVVQKDLTQRVKGFSTSFVEKDTQQKHLGSKYQQVGENLAIEVKKAYSLKAQTIKQAAKTIELDSAKGISLKVGGNVLTVDSSGIHFKTSNYDDNSANAGVTSKTVSIEDLKKPLYEKIRVIGMQTSISKQDKITQELIYTAKVEKYEDGTWSETTELNPTQTAQLKWYFIKNNDKQDRDILTNTPTDDEIEIDALIMKVKLQDDNIQHYGHAHCFVNSPEDETEGYGLSELKRQVNVVEVLGKNIVEPHSTQINYSVELNIDNPTKDEIKDLKVEIQEKDSSGKVTTIEEKVKDDLSVEHKLKAKKEDEPKLVEINIKVYPREYPKNTAETISYVRPTLEGEITNVSIDKPTQAFAKVVKPDEEIIIKANANIGEGTQIQLDIVTLLKNINEPKVCSFEEYVKNKEIQKTLTMQEIATMLSIDINDIQDIQAVVKHKDKEYKSNTVKIVQYEIKALYFSVQGSKLQGTNVPLGAKVDVIAHGTSNTTATIEVLVNKKPFKVLKDGQEVTSFDVVFDERGYSSTEVELRVKSDEEFKTLINRFSPQIGRNIITEPLALKAKISKNNYYKSLETDDTNTIGLNHYQTYIKEATIIDPKNGKVHAKLKVKQDGENVIFMDSMTGELIATAPLDNIVSSMGNINNGLGGLTKGMEYVDGTFATTNTKGVNLKHYSNSWGGNQYVKTYGMSAVSKGIGRGTLVLSVVIGGYQINSAYENDTVEIKKHYNQNPSKIEKIGQHTEQQIGSTVLGFAGGVVTSIIAVIALPVTAGVLLTVGTFVVVGGIVGWALSEAGDAGVELIQETKGSTIINDYPLHKHLEGH
ncbi:type VI secretion system Vgr family protein [Sulfurimonas sp.]|uniref:type VI secretion system Vgr family protein n=1 Tax=Sulfurimonas sp. TaxID=2022749 RepID=UPI002B485C04|nr:type VI secretion system tip protein TssI/VgrG [Sulfurimonas sp.]